jgi:hypothetical protein
MGLAFVLMMMPLPVILADFSRGTTPTYDFAAVIFPVDLAMAALVVVTAADVLKGIGGLTGLRQGAFDAGSTLWLAMVAVLTIAFVAHPSRRGPIVLMELYSVVAIAHSVTTTTDGDGRRLLRGSVAVLAVVESAWAFAQRVTGGPIGLKLLGESSRPFHRFSPTVLATQGSMVHIYVLSGLGLVAASVLAWAALTEEQPLVWQITAGIACMGVGMTYSRAGALGLVLLVGAVMVLAITQRSRQVFWLGAALVIGAAVPALIWSNGWLIRADQTTSATSASALTTARGHLTSQAVTVIKHNPVLGIGPGRYVRALNPFPQPTQSQANGDFQPVHDVPLLATAEGGLVAGAIAVGLLAALAYRAVRSGILAVGIYLAYLPFFVLDHFAYTFPQGLVLTGLWLGTLDALYRERHSTGLVGTVLAVRERAPAT